MGPFGSEIEPDKNERNKLSWYSDSAEFVHLWSPWFGRGGGWFNGHSSGIFATFGHNGSSQLNITFRIVLAPTK